MKRWLGAGLAAAFLAGGPLSAAPVETKVSDALVAYALPPGR